MEKIVQGIRRVLTEPKLAVVAGVLAFILVIIKARAEGQD